MFSKLSVIVISVLIVCPFPYPCCRHPRAPHHHPAGDHAHLPQCCSSVVPSSSSAASIVAALLGLDVSSLNVPIGLSCSPITVVGNNCGSTTVVCDAPKQEWSGLIAINCIPITL
ncbi:hypothetical protein B0H10DRAFT_2190214 [Mycena sp. CBHHK59/15]|nr:hypothetical protein B0H10DRAFT_2190214 [Mycena sp. CBHHK59/15]